MRRRVCEHGKAYYTADERNDPGCECPDVETTARITAEVERTRAELGFDREQSRIFAMGVYKGVELAERAGKDDAA